MDYDAKNPPIFCGARVIYIGTGAGCLYLAVVLDLFSRKVAERDGQAGLRRAAHGFNSGGRNLYWTTTHKKQRCGCAVVAPPQGRISTSLKQLFEHNVGS